MAMEMLWSLHLLLVLLSAPAAQSHKGSQGLSCVNDFVSTVSCTHDSTTLAPAVDCWILGVQRTWVFNAGVRRPKLTIQSCKVKHRNSPPGCSLVFENKKFNYFDVMPNISMECNGTLLESHINYKPVDHIKMQPPGVPNISSTVNETWISWSPGSPLSNLIKSFNFQVQVKHANQSWNDARTLSTQEQKLSVASQQLKGPYKVRVRVKPYDISTVHWSNWSPAATWIGASDVPAPQDPDWFLVKRSVVMQGVVLSVGVVIIMLVLYRSWMSRGRLKGKPVPNPSQYFHTLHSIHGGNLKKWLNPLSVSESFFMAQPCDSISPVEVCENWDVVPSHSPSSSSTSALLHFRGVSSVGSDTSGVLDNSSSSSCFSNMGYFMSSSSSGSARTDPNPAYFTYQEDFHSLGNGHNLHFSLCPSLTTSATYESLKREPHSPDSGFGIGQEDKEDEKDERGLDIEEEDSDHHQSSAIVILPLQLPSRVCPPSSVPPPHPASLTQVSSDGPQVDVPVAAATGSFSAWPVACAMCRSSSMPVEEDLHMAGYLTLKELQTTFSNKSI
ncbi:interleukin-2 receptor subunit beta [Mastacembelus armatus]|uniref:Interleukin 2 receptor, beta n=1 Tax=Mastacembelus armatus TaxID=205130 RepID=A0A3Q3RS00_9TELE|nr:interleukin-2 receptor subunit beta-like [Mastacembelus armatus]